MFPVMTLHCRTFYFASAAAFGVTSEGDKFTNGTKESKEGFGKERHLC
jgi:hypothetical protein